MRKEEESAKPRTTLEVSLVGSEFDRFTWENAEHYRAGEFLWIRELGAEHEILVKVRGISARPAEKSLASVRHASADRVKSLMINMVRGYLFASDQGDVRVVGGSLEYEKGHLIVDFVADEKKDLRPLGPKLAKILHVKVEFQQIGARDRAKQVGGLGRCGLEMCCSRFLGELPSITLTMARKQYLFAAPDKLSGSCGRLICCLNYELPFYEEMAERLPALGMVIKLGEREAEVIEVNPLAERFRIRYREGDEEEINLASAPEYQVVR